VGLIVILIAAWAIAKLITNYKIDREYASQGLDSPRMRMKMAKAKSGEVGPEAVARTRPGAAGYFRELWDDAWDDAAERHRARRAAKKAGVAPPERHRKPWWRYLFDPIGKADEPAKPTPPATPPPVAATEPEPTPPAPEPAKPPPPPAEPPAYAPSTEGDDPMPDTSATGDVHDVETCDHELDALTDDLTAIDTALDVIDEKVREARTSAELIQAFLAGKNVDGNVLAGLATALDMLGPDAIKTLIDGIAAAKAGVAETKDAMGPLREANELVGAADGSVLNGR
jgi:hypothetical protein